jgi:signal transduction histidine kinase
LVIPEALTNVVKHAQGAAHLNTPKPVGI